MPAIDPTTTTEAPIIGAIPAPRTEDDALHRHDGHHHPADLSEAENDAVDAAGDMYPLTAYALEHAHFFHDADPHHPDDHV